MLGEGAETGTGQPFVLGANVGPDSGRVFQGEVTNSLSLPAAAGFLSGPSVATMDVRSRPCAATRAAGTIWVVQASRATLMMRPPQGPASHL